MPGPKMGPRPDDFNEKLLKQSPTFVKWETLQDGESLRYACRTFIKGTENDEERLLRRIMIARRNNIRDHETLKVARQRVNVTILNTGNGNMKPRSRLPMASAATTTTTSTTVLHLNEAADPTTTAVSCVDPTENNTKTDPDTTTGTTITEPSTVTNDNADSTTIEIQTLESSPSLPVVHVRRPPHTFSDAQVQQEMDVVAVERTRSYRSWAQLPDGTEFLVRILFGDFGNCRCYKFWDLWTNFGQKRQTIAVSHNQLLLNYFRIPRYSTIKSI
jgi:hypothetical protein